MKILQPLEIPLEGTALIEASAGTGKTYTITALFLRFLLEKRVSIDKILVVTFTIAATEELRIKLRARIIEAIDWLKKTSENRPEDGFLEGLLSDIDQQEALQLLSDVASRLDELAVYTIDAMCLRVLQDFSFESGLPMRMDFVANDYEIRKLVAEDYWRRTIGGKDHFAIDELTSSFKSPSALLNRLTPVLRARNVVCLPDVDPLTLERDRSDLTKRFFRIMSIWEDVATEVSGILRGKGVLNRNKYRPASVEQVIQALNDLVSRESLPAELNDKFKLVTERYLASAINKGKQKPEHSFFTLCDGFNEELEQYFSRRKASVLITARNSILEATENYKAMHGILHFEDLRDRLDKTLQGKSAALLADKIRKMWPYAMIDEFQDTDPQQNRIFQTIYGNRDDCGFFQIGDPKQAIYSFRGADVFTYMSAARAVSNSYTLGTNWRSSSQLVNGVNRLFEFGRMPFIFDDTIKFRPVDAAGLVDSKPLTIKGNSVIPMQFRMLGSQDSDKPLDAKSALNIAAMNCASDIASLLIDGSAGTAVIGDKPVCAADIAILVRSHAEGKIIQDALYSVGVKSVSLSTSPVFSTFEAEELAIVLAAMAQPGKIGTIRRALVTEMIGYDAHRLEALNNSEHDWDTLFTRFVSYRETWISKGFMAAVQLMIVEMEVAQNVLAYPNGERRMTNLLQLTELMQVKSRELPSHDELLVWLEKQQSDNNLVDDDQVLRLESDEDLVKIVTIHKSKGLEYPVVYLPFPWKISEGGTSSGDITLFHHRETLESIADFGSPEKSAHKVLQTQESLAEYVRLLYVAVTRAQHLCVMCWGRVKGAENSALAYLLHQTTANADGVPECTMKGMSDSEIAADLEQLASGCVNSISVEPAVTQHHVFQGDIDYSSLILKPFTGAIDRHWKITSYTGLLSGEDNGLPDHDTVSDDQEESQFDEVDPADDNLGEIAELPAGARTGEMIHDLFENMDFTDTSDLAIRATETLKRYGNLGRRGSTQQVDWSSVVVDLVNNSLDTVLNKDSQLTLRTLAPKDRLNEMEFFFSLNGSSSVSLNKVLSQTTQYQDTATGLSFSSLTGLMRGFIDMVVRHDGKYYIIDYKSNLLGETRRFYRCDSMRRTIQSHRYDLQYLIYTVALHRYLGNRMPGYQYERDFGGVFYLFVRGMKPGDDAGVWFDRPPLQLIESMNFCFDPELEAV